MRRRLVLCGALMISCAGGPRPLPTVEQPVAVPPATAGRDVGEGPTRVTAWMEAVTGPGQLRPVKQGALMRIGQGLIIQFRTDRPAFIYLGAPGKDGWVTRLAPREDQREAPRALGQVPAPGQTLILSDAGQETLYLVAAARPLPAAELAQLRPSLAERVEDGDDGSGTRGGGQGGSGKDPDQTPDPKKVPPAEPPVSRPDRGGAGPREALAARLDERGVAVIAFQVRVRQ